MGHDAAYAAMKFVLYTVVGSLLMLVGIIALGAVVSSTAHTAYSLDLSTLLHERCHLAAARDADLAIPGIRRGLCHQMRSLPAP